MADTEKIEELLTYLDKDGPAPHAPMGLTYDAWQEVRALEGFDIASHEQDVSDLRKEVDDLTRERDGLKMERDDLRTDYKVLAPKALADETALAEALIQIATLTHDLDEARRRAFTLAHSQDQQAIAKARMRTPISIERAFKPVGSGAGATHQGTDMVDWMQGGDVP